MASIDFDVYYGHTLLHKAAWRCKTDEVRFLLAVGEDATARDNRGHVPLHRVAQPYPHAQVTDQLQVAVGRLLLQAGADVNASDQQGGTPLHVAALFGHVHMVSLLLEYSADVNAHTNNGWTPLHSAVVNGQGMVAELLLMNGADVNDAQAEYGGEKSLMPEIPRCKCTPLRLTLLGLEPSSQTGLSAEELRECEEAGVDMDAWRQRDIARLQEIAALLQQYGGVD